MVHVKFEESADGKCLILDVAGHAGSAPKHYDVICGMATLQARWLARMALKFKTMGKLKKEPTVRLEEGHATIVCKPHKDAFNLVKWTYLCAQEAYSDLQSTFPDYISLKEFGKA